MHGPMKNSHSIIFLLSLVYSYYDYVLKLLVINIIKHKIQINNRNTKYLVTMPL